MNKPIAYEVWLVKDEFDDEYLMATFENKNNALRFAKTIQDYEYESNRFNKILVEEVEYDPDGSGSCVDVALEEEL